MKGNLAATKWNERFTWFWFKEDEILRYTQEDFNRRAKELHDRGITVAINFSLTHFRFGFRRYFDTISESIRMFVNACHQYGIKVVEHHSASLTHNLLSSSGWGRFEDDLGSYSNWTASVDTWIDVPRYLICDPEIDGKPLKSMFQIDGRTGKVADTVYSCNCFCYNNPDYRAAYFAYIEELIVKTGIDGIMNDDVQYFADGNACTCPHCRRLFKEKYGYDIPQPEEWDAFYDDYDNPVFVAWERFKRESAEDMYRSLTVFYEKLGVKLIRPNYCSDILESNSTAYAFDICCDLWDFIFQENCFSTIIKASYMNFMTEAVHRYAAAQRNGVPSMSMFYPDREDTIYFSWAFSKAWGQLYTGTSEGVDTTGMEKKYRDFERDNSRLFAAPEKLTDVSFYLSLQTRDYTKDSAEKYMRPFMAGIQAAGFSGLGTNMVFESDDVEELLKHPRIVASHIALASDEELSRFKEYVERGGQLVILGEFGLYNKESKRRDRADLLQALGVTAKMDDCEYRGCATVSYNREKLKLDDVVAISSFNGAKEAICTTDDGIVIGIREQLGNGEILWFSFDMGQNELQQSIWSKRRQKVPERAEAASSKLALMRANTGALLHLVVGIPKIEMACEQDELFVSGFEVENGLAVHIVNISDTIPKEKCFIGHEDLIPNFVSGAKRLPEITLAIQKPKIAVKDIVLKTPEREGALKIQYREEGDQIKLLIPADTFSGYALICINA